jgi:hypothetical protein
MAEIAAEVSRLRATGLVLVADTWWLASPEELPPGKRPGEVKERREGLMAIGIRSDGERRVLFTPYRRRFRRIQLGETMEISADQAFFLAPVLRAWGLPVPSEQEAVERMYQEGPDRSGSDP